MISAVFVTFISMIAAPLSAQWSIGAPGTREAPAGKHRYVMLVFANPVPGREAEFNDWYTNTHMGDLLQLQGWVGAQRYRIVTTVQPRPTAAGYQHGYVILWDLEETDANTGLARITAAIAGGKSRKSPAFDYTPGASGGGTYEALGPRTVRAGGNKPTMPDWSDNHTPRSNRYILMEFANALPGHDAEFEKASNRRIQEALKLPGWMAVQRFRVAETPGRAPSTKPQYLNVWETEGVSAQTVQDTWGEALKSGELEKNSAADEKTIESVYWEPISPYVTKDDFTR